MAGQLDFIWEQHPKIIRNWVNRWLAALGWNREGTGKEIEQGGQARRENTAFGRYLRDRDERTGLSGITAPVRLQNGKILEDGTENMHGCESRDQEVSLSLNRPKRDEWDFESLCNRVRVHINLHYLRRLRCGLHWFRRLGSGILQVSVQYSQFPAYEGKFYRRAQHTAVVQMRSESAKHFLTLFSNPGLHNLNVSKQTLWYPYFFSLEVCEDTKRFREYAVNIEEMFIIKRSCSHSMVRHTGVCGWRNEGELIILAFHPSCN